MARQIGQKMRFDDVELALMKAVFANNENLLFIIRKVMLQGELTEDERSTLVSAMTPELYKLLRKVFLPEIDLDAPLFQIADPYIGLNADVEKVGPEEFWPVYQAKKLEFDFIDQQLECLRDVNEHREPTISFKDMVKGKGTKAGKEELYINIMARNYLLSFVDSSLQQVKFLAGSAEETVEETKERLARDSSK